MPPRKFVALRYMEGFSCIGPDCEDNCCHHWNVVVDQSTHQKLKKAMGRDPQAAARFERSFKLLPPAERNRDAFAEIPDAAGGDCPMLDEARLCSIHAQHGEALLPAVCSIYPRRVHVIAGRAELSGSISCPEIARRALLVPGGAELLEVQPSLFGDPRRTRIIDPASASPYEVQLDELRGTLHQLLSLGEYPIASRLYFVVTLAERVSAYLNSESTSFDEDALKADVRDLETPELRDALHEQFRALPSEGPLATSVLAQALSARLVADRAPRMIHLVDRLFNEYATGGGARNDGSGNWTLSPEPLWVSYLQRWEKLRTTHGERIDRWFQNYCQHHVIHELYCDAPSLFVYAQTLVLKTALIRFLLVGHPLVTEALDKPEAEAGALLDRAIVEVVYSLSRSFDHSARFFEMLTRALKETLGHSATVALLKL
jgi:lysine-N-methylase